MTRRTDTITGYVILRRDKAIHEEGVFITVEDDTNSADTTYTDDTVEPSRKYVYRIKAINTAGLSEISSWARAYTPPAKPTGLSASATHQSVTLTWDDPNDDAITGYVVLRRIPRVDPEGQFSELVSNTGTDAITYTGRHRRGGNSLHLPHQRHQRTRGERAVPLAAHRHRSRARGPRGAGCRTPRQAQGPLRSGVPRPGDPDLGQP